MKNIIGYKLDRAFGPVGLSAGITLIIAGIVGSIYSLPAITLVIIGAFTAFTESYTYLDIDRKRIRLSYNFFGFIRSGQWIELDPNMKVGIKKVKKSTGNHTAVPIEYLIFQMLTSGSLSITIITEKS